MVGKIACSGIGVPVPEQECKAVDTLWDKHVESNAKLMGTLKEDDNSAWLLEHTVAEARMGRMSEPVCLSRTLLEGWLLQPRFAVEQTRGDGSKKYRAVDHFSWSSDCGKEGSINGFTVPGLNRLQYVALSYVTGCVGRRKAEARYHGHPGRCHEEVCEAL